MSGAKSARILRSTVISKYANTMANKPTPCRRSMARRSARFIGLRRERVASSCAVGAGICFNIHTKTTSGSAKISPATHGIQRSGTPLCSSADPTDFATPSARTKLAHKPATNSSVRHRPSRNPSTRPKIMPRASPFTNSHTALNGTGVTAKRARASSATATMPRNAAARRAAVISPITLMPTIFESM